MHLTYKRSFAVLIGNALEYYDFMLYGFFAAMLAPLFFPHDNPAISLIASMGSYSIAFLARPLGGIFFGHLGDRWGRKDTLSLSILCVTLPTLMIGLLPTYASIGIWAPILLLLCRFVQGFCLGGETSGAMTYMIENASGSQKDLSSSWIVASCYGGTLVGTLLGSLFTMSFMPDWGWRLTFIVGSLIALVGYYIRRHFKESPEFLNAQKTGKILKVPIQSLLKHEKQHLMYAAGVASAVIVPFIVIFIYLSNLLLKVVHLEPSFVLFLNAGLMCFWIGALLFFGALAQRYGRKMVMVGGLIGMAVCSYPLFIYLGDQPTLSAVLWTQLILSIFASAYAAPTSAFLVDLFPVNQRYSGIAIGYSLGHAIFGGLTPVLITTIVQAYGFTAMPALCIIATCFLGLLPLSQNPYVFKPSLKPSTN